MCTAHIICQNFETRDRVRAHLIVEDKVAVGLVAVSLLRTGGDIDHALPDRAALSFKRTFEQQVAGAVRSKVILLGVVVEMLGSIRRVEARHTSLRTFADQIQV